MPGGRTHDTCRPWFPYRLTGAIISTSTARHGERPWFPYRLTGAIMQGH